jgi:phosphatidylglycerophosphate synthase
MSELGARKKVAVSYVGKVKTAAQMSAIFLLILDRTLTTLPVYEVGFVLLYLATALTLTSMVQYLRAAWPELTRD